MTCFEYIQSDSLFGNFCGMRSYYTKEQFSKEQTESANTKKYIHDCKVRFMLFFLSRRRSYKLFNISSILCGLQHCPALLHLQNSQHGIDNDLQAQTFSRENLRQLHGVG